MHDVRELLRLPSPAPAPQSLAYDGQTLWMGSRETRRIYGIDPLHWQVTEEVQAPGIPWGMTVVGDELRVICGEGAEDHRTIRRFIPGHGFRTEGAIPCPDDTGSQLGFDGERLYVSQWYNRRLLSLDLADGSVGTIVDVPHQICGQVILNGIFHLVTTEDEESDDYFLTTVDARSGPPLAIDVARIPFKARALAHDGGRFWSNHRAANEIVAFDLG